MTAVERIAAACHEVNRTYCEVLGDHSQPRWAEAPEWQKSSAIAGVEAWLDNPGMSPAELHAKWLAYKERDGWMYGTEKDPKKKTHPCMLPYDQLPRAQQAKDALFAAVVDGLAGHATALSLGPYTPRR